MKIFCLQFSLPWAPMLEESLPDPLAFILSDDPGHSHYSLVTRALLPQLSSPLEPHLPFLCSLHNLLLLEPCQETIYVDESAQARAGELNKLLSLSLITLVSQASLDVESMVRDLLRPHWSGLHRSPAVSQSPPGDLPPKYEDLGEWSIQEQNIFVIAIFFARASPSI